MKFTITFLFCLIFLNSGLLAQQPSLYNYGREGKQEAPVKTTSKKPTLYVLDVYDALGRSVYRQEVDTVMVSLSSCAFKKGSYYYIVADRKKKVVKKGEFTVDF